MKILPLFTHPHVIPKQQMFVLEHKIAVKNILQNMFCFPWKEIAANIFEECVYLKASLQLTHTHIYLC